MNRSFFSAGAITANLTPLNADLTVDEGLLQDHCRFLLNNGSDGLALLGTTGEANSFSVAERKQIVEAMDEFDRDKLMVGTGCCAYTETIELTQHALDHGITNFLMLPPYYYKQVDDEGMLAYFDKIIGSVGAERLHIYLYHFPKLAGVSFSHDLVTELLHAFPETIVGMKDSTGDPQHMQEVREMFPGFRLYAGTEKYLLENLEGGGVGCISATANVTISLIASTLAQWHANGSKSGNDYLVKVRKSFEGLPFTGALKSYLAEKTQNEAWLNVRPPNHPITPNQLDDLIRQHEDLDYHPKLM